MRHAACVLIAAPVLAASLAACKPVSSPVAPPDLLQTQHQSLDKAKAVEGVLLKQDQDRRRSIDDSSR